MTTTAATTTTIGTTTTVAATTTVVATTGPAPNERILVVYDDDGSPDGTVALPYLLIHPNVEVISVNLTYGEVYPEIYIQHLARLMDAYGFAGIPLGVGEIPSAEGAIHFPEFLRDLSSGFWGMPVPNPDETYPTGPAAEQIVNVVNGSPDPVRVFVTGPSTNLAAALRLDPGIAENIIAVHMMGGAVYAPGNVHDFFPDHPNVFAEWNMVADPPAAQEVFESGLPIRLVPLDATNRVMITQDDTRAWGRGEGLAEFASDLYGPLVGLSETGEAPIWDLMTAVIMVHPEMCELVPLHLMVVTDQGDHLGQTAVVAGEPPNVLVCLEPDTDAIRQHLIDVFSSSR
jgi:inosine-uridine nucleoside N-ribohydrolase